MAEKSMIESDWSYVNFDKNEALLRGSSNKFLKVRIVNDNLKLLKNAFYQCKVLGMSASGIYLIKIKL